MVECKYASAPSELWVGDNLSQMKPVKPSERFLCSWAIYSEQAVAKLESTPTWLQRNALSGHLMKKGDCETCPCFERGKPVE